MVHESCINHAFIVHLSLHRASIICCILSCRPMTCVVRSFKLWAPFIQMVSTHINLINKSLIIKNNGSSYQSVNWVFPFISQVFASDMFLRVVSSYGKAQAYFRVMFVFKCLASWRLKQQVFNEISKHLDQQLIALVSRFPSGRQSGLKLQCWYGNPMANNFFQNRILDNSWIAKLKYQVEDCIHQVWMM